MTERLLQFIWQFHYFNKAELTTTSGQSIEIIYQGHLNSNQGPDFNDARIMINGTLWAGAVELHINSSDWQKHSHSDDDNYKNVILHVVWIDDAVNEGSAPVLELNSRVSKFLLSRYEQLMQSSSFIPCEESITGVNELTLKIWLERLVAERLSKKAMFVDQLVDKSNDHWEESFWWLLARNFGVKVNADAFESIARSIPLNVLAKHKNQLHQLEALLFGQAGLLENDFTEDYPTMLQKEYRFLKTKHNLVPVHIPVHFLRMRPGNFPTIRLAQLAMLIQRSSHLFSKIREADNLETLRQSLIVTANDYWHYHYRFDETSSFRKKNIGDQMINNIIINTIVPVLFAYGNYHGEIKYKAKALQWLEQTGSEKNSITENFGTIGIGNRNAYESQALIELKNEYCNKRRCLDCAIGNYLLKRTDK
ncbi:MAG: DUF2851 family protein [Chitinophagaceae bacterium]